MRYGNARKYPITQMKKASKAGNHERFMDLSIGAAAGLLALVFAEGMLWGYMIKKWRE